MRRETMVTCFFVSVYLAYKRYENHFQISCISKSIPVGFENASW